MAKTLASLCRQFKRNDASGWADYTCAIEEYEDDLDWLYHTYYKGRFDFPWPETYQENYD